MLEVTYAVASEVSVVVPCYNEEATIARVIDRIFDFLRTLPGNVASEIVAVDDGSRDTTASVLQAYSAEWPDRVRIVRHVKNSGLSAAMLTGARAARYATLVFLDADLSYVPETIGQLLAAIDRTHAAVAIASPYMSGGRVRNVPLLRLIASRAANLLLSRMVDGRIRTFTGMVRAYDAGIFRELGPRLGDVEFNAGMIAAILRSGGGLVEIPAALEWPAHRTAGASRIPVGTLWARVRLVVRTMGSLARSGTGWAERAEMGPYVLVRRHIEDPSLGGPNL